MAIIEELKGKQAKGQAYGLDLARVYVGLGDKDQAFAELEKDFQAHSSTLPPGYFFHLSTRYATTRVSRIC